MNDQARVEQSTPEPRQGTAERASGAVIPPASDVKSTPLTPDEQMALFEQELKENDWGHQPC